MTPEAPVRKTVLSETLAVEDIDSILVGSVDVREWRMGLHTRLQSQEIRSSNDIIVTLDWKPAQRASSEGMRGRSFRNQGRSSPAAPSQINAETHWPEATETATPWPHHPTTCSTAGLRLDRWMAGRASATYPMTPVHPLATAIFAPLGKVRSSSTPRRRSAADALTPPPSVLPPHR